MSTDALNVLEITDIGASVENYSSSPRTGDAYKSENINACLQFQSISQTVSKSVLFGDALRISIHSIFLSVEPRPPWEPWADPGHTPAPRGGCSLLSPDWLGVAHTCQDAGLSARYSQGPRG